MKKAIFLLTIVLLSHITFGQKNLTLQDSITNYFNEIKVATKKNQQLWGKDLYGALLFSMHLILNVNKSCRLFGQGDYFLY